MASAKRSMLAAGPRADLPIRHPYRAEPAGTFGAIQRAPWLRAAASRENAPSLVCEGERGELVDGRSE
jgi:hypothetical protein